MKAFRFLLAMSICNQALSAEVRSVVLVETGSTGGAPVYEQLDSTGGTYIHSEEYVSGDGGTNGYTIDDFVFESPVLQLELLRLSVGARDTSTRDEIHSLAIAALRRLDARRALPVGNEIDALIEDALRRVRDTRSRSLCNGSLVLMPPEVVLQHVRNVFISSPRVRYFSSAVLLCMLCHNMYRIYAETYNITILIQHFTQREG